MAVQALQMKMTTGVFNFHPVSLRPSGILSVFMENPLKSILQMGNPIISSRSRGSWPTALANPVGIETISSYSEFNDPSPKPCPENLVLGVGRERVKPPPGLPHFPPIFYITEGFQQSQKKLFFQRNLDFSQEFFGWCFIRIIDVQLPVRPCRFISFFRCKIKSILKSNRKTVMFIWAFVDD